MCSYICLSGALQVLGGLSTLQELVISYNFFTGNLAFLEHLPLRVFRAKSCPHLRGALPILPTQLTDFAISHAVPLPRITTVTAISFAPDMVV